MATQHDMFDTLCACVCVCVTQWRKYAAMFGDDSTLRGSLEKALLV